MQESNDNLDNLLNKFKTTYNVFHIKNMLKYLEIENNTVTAARFAVCGQGLSVQRLTESESAVIGHPVSQELPKSLLNGYFNTIKHNSSASNDYLAHLSAVLINNSMRGRIEG